jgi:hypothetical protein
VYSTGMSSAIAPTVVSSWILLSVTTSSNLSSMPSIKIYDAFPLLSNRAHKPSCHFPLDASILSATTTSNVKLAVSLRIIDKEYSISVIVTVEFNL